MEQGIEDRYLRGLLSRLREVYQLPDQDIRSYSPLTLAYIGDAVYELVIRTYVTGKGNAPVEKLHHEASTLVKAQTQSEMSYVIREELEEEELAVYKRGRNAHSYTRAKNASVSDYRRATGFEALMGYLYLTGQYERMLQLIRRGMEKYGIYRTDD